MNSNEAISGLAARITAVETDIRNLSSSMEKLTDSIDSMGQKISATTKTNWGVLGTWFGASVALMGGLVHLSLNPVSELAHQNYESIKQHTQTIGHLGMIERTNALFKNYEEGKDTLKAQNENLQREMRLLFEIIEERMHAMERHVFGESVPKK